MKYVTRKCKANKCDECKACLCSCKCHDEQSLKQNPYGFGELVNEGRKVVTR
jgi:hypothetical protein